MSRIISIHGKHILNAKRRLLFAISLTDVKEGKRQSPDQCAAAKACVREFGAISARVHTARTYLEFPKHWMRFTTPKKLRDEIVKFDQKGVFEPGAYELTPVQPSHQPNGKRLGTNGHGASETKRKRSKPHVLEGVRNSPVNSY